MNKPLFNCGICGHDWPDDYLKCPDKECQAPFRMRVARETLRPQEAALRPQEAEPVKRRIAQLIVHDGHFYALADDGTAWVIIGAHWQKIENLPDA